MTPPLKRLNVFSGRPGPLLLVIMDGIGIGPRNDSNGVFLAQAPHLNRLFASALYTELRAHGTAVGLPTDEDMGNSEVGHNALGAGRVFDQGSSLVHKAIAGGHIFRTELWSQILQKGRQGRTIHFIGLLSDGNVHSHIEQLYALIDQCAAAGMPRVRVHALADGRDVGERSALNYFIPLEQKLSALSDAKKYDYRIASGGGRMKVTMDRYNADWNIVKKGWDAHVRGLGRLFSSAEQAIRTYYAEDPHITDQYLDSFVITGSDGEPNGRISDGDAVIFFNFRGDRAIEISRAFTEKEFREFERGPLPDVLFAGMMQYDGDTHMPPNFLVAPPVIDRTISEYLCATQVRSFAVSETQKFGHVTYFWNGNRSGYIDSVLETYAEIPSDRIEFDQAPKMKAFEIKNKVNELLKTGSYRFGRVNFANGDMVGHTGNMPAVITAVETVDQCIGEILKTIEALKGIAIITADHGNADEMFSVDAKGRKNVRTAHSLNPVPFVIYDPLFQGEYGLASVDKPGLSNVAATLLNLLGYEKPEEYDPSLIAFR
ncbi:MAG: 2,3-bisphosphoglycerate-independent phosphoglycerate mutase [Desulfobacteraceae bacterium]|nr:MAG: 2,3-bisphosphoglycerate-independent phosphoglycerate mutase [Desulfobacteraceae bacterium]